MRTMRKIVGVALFCLVAVSAVHGEDAVVVPSVVPPDAVVLDQPAPIVETTVPPAVDYYQPPAVYEEPPVYNTNIYENNWPYGNPNWGDEGFVIGREWGGRRWGGDHGGFHGGGFHGGGHRSGGFHGGGHGGGHRR